MLTPSRTRQRTDGCIASGSQGVRSSIPSSDLQVYRMTTGNDGSTVVSTPRSNKAGEYRVTQRRSGPGAYQMRYRGSRTTSNFSSQIDGTSPRPHDHDAWPRCSTSSAALGMFEPSD